MYTLLCIKVFIFPCDIGGFTNAYFISRETGLGSMSKTVSTLSFYLFSLV